MKNNIEVISGNTLGQYIITKKRGKLTLEEILEALRNYDEDKYFVIIDARSDTYQGWNDTEKKGNSFTAWKLWSLDKALHGE